MCTKFKDRQNIFMVLEVVLAAALRGDDGLLFCVFFLDVAY
jgi:hypothetical protein